LLTLCRTARSPEHTKYCTECYSHVYRSVESYHASGPGLSDASIYDALHSVYVAIELPSVVSEALGDDREILDDRIIDYIQLAFNVEFVQRDQFANG
jgi:hypothetical protein